METTKGLTGTVFGTLEFNGWTIEYEVVVTGSETYIPDYPDEYDCEGPYLEYIDYINIDDVENPDLILEQNREYIEQAIKQEVEEELDWDDISWQDDYEPDEPEPDEPEPDDFEEDDDE